MAPGLVSGWCDGSTSRSIPPQRRSSDRPPGCREHCRKLLAVLDEYAETEEKLLAAFNRLDRIWDREYATNWRLFKRIIRTRATTLPGAAAQLKLIELEGALTESHGDGVNGHVLNVARNIGRLVAALPGEGVTCLGTYTMAAAITHQE